MGKAESKKMTAASLPFDVLISIFRFLGPNSKGKAARVCISWKEAADCQSIWKNVELRLRSGIPNEHSKRCIVKRDVKRLDVWPFEPRINDFLHQIPNLEYLRIAGYCRKRKLLEIFNNVPDCVDRYIIDPGFELDVQNLRVLCGLIDDCIHPFHVNNLNLHKCQHNIVGMLKTFTSGMKKLKELCLQQCVHYPGVPSSCTDWKDITKDEQSPSMQKLHLKEVQPLDEGSFDYISNKFFNLVYLNLERCILVSDRGFEHLIRLKKLEYLRVVRPLNVTGTWLKYIGQILSLKYLELTNCDSITDVDLQFISGLVNLTNLKIIFCNFDTDLIITDTAWKHLNKLPHLRELNLDGSEISDMGLLHLAAGNLKLTKLSLSNCLLVGDQGLMNICQSSFALRDLDISLCHNITDYGVRCVVKKFSYLRVLNLTLCSKVTHQYRKKISEEFSQTESLNQNVIKIIYDSRITRTDTISDRMKYLVKRYYNK